ncbi:MAG TPA: NADP-dependent oxidoreductase [Candidatus Bathyarchaeia archaeon]|nr:NADP-dependent oxidoreductase [Candidatus Bathyarchaeia archaeon]
MKAAQIDNYGDASAIHVREVEKPMLIDGQVLVEVGAASLNPFDLAVLAGYAQSMAPLTFPATLGLDMAGKVAAVGDGVSSFEIGDRVYGTANAMLGASGAFAEFAAVNAANLGHAPENISDEEAASFPTAAVSALQAINSMNVESGQKVFIHGGAGGVGAIAIQIAKHRGAHVAATASAANSDFVKSLGADEVIDYKTQDFKEILHAYDAVLTTVRSDNNINEALDVLKQGGIAISLVGPFDAAKAKERGVTATAQMTRVSTASLDGLRALVEQGAVKPTVDRTVTLDQIQDAYMALATESIKGKIVISFRE